jgi:hypothetical protein
MSMLKPFIGYSDVLQIRGGIERPGDCWNSGDNRRRAGLQVDNADGAIAISYDISCRAIGKSNPFKCWVPGTAATRE